MLKDEIEDALLEAKEFILGNDIYRRSNAERALARIKWALTLRGEEARQKVGS